MQVRPACVSPGGWGVGVISSVLHPTLQRNNLGLEKQKRSLTPTARCRAPALLPLPDPKASLQSPQNQKGLQVGSWGGEPLIKAFWGDRS